MTIAVILVRGRIGLTADKRKTLEMLGLTRKNQCALVEDSPRSRGMMQKIKDSVAWGPVSEETVKRIRAKGDGVVGLAPPIGGFGGIKISYQQGGALGQRSKTMDALVARMLR